MVVQVVYIISIINLATGCCGCEIIRVHFVRLSVEKEKSCLFDSVSVYDGAQEKASKRIGRYCGHRRPPDALSTGRVILVILKTDNTVNEGGFNVTWSSEISKGSTSREEFVCF